LRVVETRKATTEAMHTPSELTDHARVILAEAQQYDGTPALSDQALLAVAQGRRSLFDFGEAVGVLGEGELDLVVRPSARGKGLGGAALREMLTAHGESAPLRAWVHGVQPAADALLQAANFVPVRSLVRMTLDVSLLQSARAQARPMPADFSLVRFDPSNAQHADDWVRVNSRAFADHPEQGAVTREDFDSLTREKWFDPADLFLAYDERESHPRRLAGFTWIKTTRANDHTETELYVIGVDPEFAGRGLGAALLGVTLARMAEHTPDRISLYVDGENAQALSLYERAGFFTEQLSRQWARSVHLAHSEETNSADRM
jgi:mycothiol synthase